MSRKPEKDKLTQFHMDVAATIQSVTEEILLKMTNHLYNEYKIPNICLAGGVALHCVKTERSLNKKSFKKV